MCDVLVGKGTGIKMIITDPVIKQVKNMSPDSWGKKSDQDIATMVGRGILNVARFKEKKHYPAKTTLSLTPPKEKKPQRVPLGLEWSLDGIKVIALGNPQGQISQA